MFAVALLAVGVWEAAALAVQPDPAVKQGQPVPAGDSLAGRSVASRSVARPVGQATPPQAHANESAQSAAPASATGAEAPSVLPLTSDQVAAHLGETVDWFHHLASIEQLQIATVDSAASDKLRQQALKVVELAFDFGKACAALLDAQSRQAAGSATTSAAANAATPAKGFAGRLDQAAADVDQRIDGLQAKLDALKEQIAHARGKQRETLTAQQGEVTAALRLAREVQSSVQDMEDFEASSIAGDSGNLSPLDGQIADMERSVPEMREASAGRSRRFDGQATGGTAAESGGGAHGSSGSGAGSTVGSGAANGSPGAGSGGSSAAAAGGATGASGGSAPGSTAASMRSATSTNFHAASAGVIALIAEWFSLNDMRRQLNDFIKETGDLQDEIEKVRASLTSEVRTVVGNDLAISTSTDPAELVAQRQALEADSARFKQLATVLVPLGEQALIVESALDTLDDWSETLETRMTSVVRYLALRIGIVLGWIAVVLIVSEIWRRATFRYLHDLRRRRQFMVLRRVAVAAALTLVIAFGLVSEIGSIATYIGFVTAGIAVALQNVILAVVAYFFLIGRYGVRVGDRITLAGVTGRVVDIGLVRIYLMELSGPDLHSTGRMVVLSNAVLFQPTALFKQIPGADYVWHTVTLTIAATADVLEAHKRLKAAAEEVYEKYRSAIERQHAVVQRFIDFDASSPQPEIRVRLTENGLECSVRYPVELENAALIDQRMLKALRDALEQDSQFKLVSTGAVVLKSSDA